MLHSYYTMPIILYRGGVPTTYTVRWYKAPVGAKYLGIPSCIFSHVWDNNPGESVPGEVGEVGAPRTWDKGDNRGGYQGQCFRGDPAWFATGRLPALLPAPGPCPCNIPPGVGAGGMVLGGTGSPCAAANLGGGCLFCTGGAAVNFTATLTGGTGDFAQFNGSRRLAQGAGNCIWYNNCFGIGTLKWLGPGNLWNYDAQDPSAPGTRFAQYRGPMDCLAGGTLPLQASGGGGNPAPAVVLAPH